MAGHASDGIIQDNHRCVGLVTGNIDQPRDTGMNEGGVTDDRYRLLRVFFSTLAASFMTD